jgi:membrane-bound lytic murein transglycosylase A
VTNRGEVEGLFTGYYEPTLQGSRRRGGRFQVPLYKTPNDMVAVDLGAFRDDLEGRKITGRIAGDRFLPYHDREAIDRGALAGRNLELVWVDSAVDAFFLEIQGSGRVEMDDGSSLRLGYAGQNGHPYYAIGRELVQRGHMEVEEVSMQSIRGYLEEHPDEGAEIMRTNPSYVFFRQLTGPGPLGSLGVALTPGRSLAIDQSILPLGAPMWLAAEAPAPTPREMSEAGDSARAIQETQRLERLIVGQDTGGAIEGPVRGDVFWGPGDEAADVAGRMKHAGRLWVFLPKGFEPIPPPDPAES